MEVAAGIYAYQVSGTLGDTLRAKMKDLQNQYNPANASVVERSWDVLQYDVSAFK